MHIAVVGCGQLSRMLALAGLPMGFKFSFINDTGIQAAPCVQGLGKVIPWQTGQSFEALYEALEEPDCITVEKEQLDINLVKALEALCPVRPTSRAVAACQNRFHEKQLLEMVGVPSAPYTYSTPAIDTLQTLDLPLVAKSCCDGYDGKNQWVLNNLEDAENFDADIAKGTEFIIEKKIPFTKEVSQVSVRGLHGDINHYPLTENQHSQGILTKSIAPARDIEPKMADLAQKYISNILNELDYVGVLAMECFVVGEQLLVNELAPRVHNSGHWTQAGNITSQFENHLRAISGLSLGNTKISGVNGMVNLIGTSKPPVDRLTEKTSLHWYNKEVRPGRKLGHVNFTANDYEPLLNEMDVFKGV